MLEKSNLFWETFWKGATDVCLRILRQELYHLGILYDDDEDIAPDSLTNSVSCDVPVQQSIPFIIRYGKPKRSRRRSRSTWRSPLPLYLSFSELGDDADIARLLSSTTTTHTPTIQHRTLKSLNTDIDIPQSLPTPSALAFGSGSPHQSISCDNTPPSIPIRTVTIPPHSFDPGDWTLIPSQHTTTQLPTPTISESEAWILIDDS